MKIAKIDVRHDDVDSIEEVLSQQPVNSIAYLNWEDEFPSSPKVSFRIGHNGSHLFLQYFVEENEILAKTEEDHGAVWTDSCVEFFISFPGSPFYYNAEFSCIGKMLFGYRKDKKDAEYGNAEVMASIKRYSSLGTDNFDHRKGDFKWNLLAVIPATAFWKEGFNCFDRVKACANFYKCGDNLTVPHFLSWAPIETENPNFHTVEFFQSVEFE